MANTTCSDDGTCSSCKPGYAGTKCEKCADGYFKRSDGSCQECNCELAGSLNQTCNDKGQCICKDRLITGDKCNKCVAKFFNYPNCRGKPLFNFCIKTRCLYLFCSLWMQ